MPVRTVFFIGLHCFLWTSEITEEEDGEQNLVSDGSVFHQADLWEEMDTPSAVLSQQRTLCCVADSVQTVILPPCVGSLPGLRQVQAQNLWSIDRRRLCAVPGVGWLGQGTGFWRPPMVWLFCELKHEGRCRVSNTVVETFWCFAELNKYS